MSEWMSDERLKMLGRFYAATRRGLTSMDQSELLDEVVRARASEASKSAELKAAQEVIGRLRESLSDLETLLQSKDAQIKAIEAAHAAAEARWDTCEAERIAGLKRLDEKSLQILALGRALLGLLPYHSFVTTRDEAERVTAAQTILRDIGMLP